MTESLSKNDLRLRWIAFILTIGELGWAISSSFHGDMWALYLTITYWIRETKGGAHYHEIVVHAVHIVYVDCRRRFTVPGVLALTHEPAAPLSLPSKETTTSIASPS